MTNNSYINNIYEIILNGRKHLGLCVKELEDEVVCFWVNHKSKQQKDTYKICNDENVFSGFNVEYGCVFKINKKCIAKHLYSCSMDTISELKELYSKLPRLSMLREKEKLLREQLNNAPSKEKRVLIRKLNDLCMQISKRECVFLYQTDKKENNPYSMYRIIPNKEGYISTFRGGSCSGK